MKGGVSSSTKKLTFNALLAAMSVALIFLGSMLEVLDLSMAALASFFCIFSVIEFRGMYPWLVYLTTGILSVILMPYSLSGWAYLLFLGFYPIVKEKFEKFNKITAWILKIATLTVSFVLCLLAVYLFVFSGGETIVDVVNGIFGSEFSNALVFVVMYVAVLAVFVLYDVALTRLISFYLRSLRERFKFLRF